MGLKKHAGLQSWSCRLIKMFSKGTYTSFFYSLCRKLDVTGTEGHILNVAFVLIMQT